MGSKFNVKLLGYKPYDNVYFFPYTTDLPQMGWIKYKGQHFDTLECMENYKKVYK